MVRLVLLLLGVDYLRQRSRALMTLGAIWIVAGVFVFIDALDNALYFPIDVFAYLFLAEGVATLAVAGTGVGGQRLLRHVKGIAVIVAACLILAGHHHGNFILSMIFGSLFMVDGLLQCASAYVVRYRRWRVTLTLGRDRSITWPVCFYQPYATHHVGTLPYALGLFLIFGGLNRLLRYRR
jgi:uncharacterized membrane protein HdeD (DUF308 family)